MTFESIEKEIIAQLQPLEQLNVTAITLPEKVSEIGQTFDKSGVDGWVQLEWIQSVLGDYSIREENAGLEITYNLDVYCENLRDSPSSLYNVINQMASLLWGFRPSRAYRPSTYVQSETLRFDANYWLARFELTVYVLAGSLILKPDTSQDPIATTITFNTEIPGNL